MKRISRIMLCVILTAISFYNVSRGGDEIVSNAATAVTISLSKTSEVIPTSSSSGKLLVKDGLVLYKVTIKAVVKNSSGKSVVGVPVKFNDPNTDKVKLIGKSGSTDNNGACYAYYEVRQTTTFTCKATVTGSYSGSKSKDFSPAVQADYASKFYITCYNTVKESECTGAKTGTFSGLAGKYKTDFVSKVNLNGSGYSESGKWIRTVTDASGNVTSHKFEKPLTCTGTSPKAGRTIAVDWDYIPRVYVKDISKWRRGCVAIADIGNRVAEDSGSAIQKYRIDVYVGMGQSAVDNFKHSKTYKKVTFMGNNVWSVD